MESKIGRSEKESSSPGFHKATGRARYPSVDRTWELPLAVSCSTLQLGRTCWRQGHSPGLQACRKFPTHRLPSQVPPRASSASRFTSSRLPTSS